MFRFLLPLLLTLFLSAPAYSKDPIRSVDGKVIKVSDGDTLHILTSNDTKLKIRLAGIDAPETAKINKKTGWINKPGQPFGEECRKFVETLIDGKTVRVDIYGIDRYKRGLSFVFIDGRNLNVEIVTAGLAEVYQGGVYGPFKRGLIEAENSAREAKKGMWALGDSYESPREFRKRLRLRGN